MMTEFNLKCKLLCVKPTTRQEGGYTTKGRRPWPTADPGDKHPYKNPSDTSPFHNRRQEQPEDLPTGKNPNPRLRTTVGT